MNVISNECCELIHIIKGILGGECTAQMNPSVDYDVLFSIARRNSVANTVADCICDMDEIPKEVKEKFERQKLVIIAQQLNRERALQVLYSELDRHHIRGIFLKGTLLCDLYPQPFIRSMSDVDVYAEEKDMEVLHPLMLSLGYQPGVIGKGNHYEYMLGEMVKVEYHPELVALTSAYGEAVFGKLYPDGRTVAKHMDVWENSIPLEGREFARQLLPEYHYTYVIMHMMNHFLTAGTGIRSIMDVWVMNRHYESSWNRGLVDELLESFGLVDFERYSLMLAHKWFDLTGLPNLPLEVDETVLDGFEAYILGSGTYGSAVNMLGRKMGGDASVTRKALYLVSRFFLPYDKMSEAYPVLKRVPVLLPLVWLYRPVELMINRRDRARRKFKTVVSVDKGRITRQSKLFDALLPR